MKCLQLIALGSSFILPLQISGNSLLALSSPFVLSAQSELADAPSNEEEALDQPQEEKIYPVSRIDFAYDQTTPNISLLQNWNNCRSRSIE